jgi:type IV pilus assembly protein PilX
MNKTLITRKSLFGQSGATLIVSLVILAVITLLGVASMRSSNMELRMAASARDRAVAFQRAESALLRIESELRRNPYKRISFDTNCTGSKCFKPDCTNGLCFNGEDDSQASRKQCKLASTDPSSVSLPAWKDADLDIWNNSNRHIQLSDLVVTEAGKTAPPVKYVIEFLCFVPAGDRDLIGGGGGSMQTDETDLPLYRITVRAEGEANRASVILQSVFRGTI